jgi:hypothetical protein
LTGKVVETMDEAVSAVETLVAMDRFAVRRAFEARFTASRMAHDYVSLYESLAAMRETSVSPSQAALSLSHPPVEERLAL